MDGERVGWELSALDAGTACSRSDDDGADIAHVMVSLSPAMIAAHTHKTL